MVNNAIDWTNGDGTKKRIEKFLQDVDNEFVPSLGSRVDIPQYASKLARLAETVFIMDNSRADIASCSIYCNQSNAYISSIAVKKQYQGQGVGSMLMKEVICHVKGKCKAIVLHVHRENQSAICYYKKNGFRENSVAENWIEMVYSVR